LSKHRGIDRSDSSLPEGNEGSKASLEAIDACRQIALPKNLPEAPSGKSFLELVPYIYDYCDAMAKTQPNASEIDVDVPLPNGKPFRIEPHRLVNHGYTMVDAIGLGKSGVLKCHYDVTSGTIKFDKSFIELHSTEAAWLGSRKAKFTLDRDQASKRTYMIFNSPTPRLLREKLHADPRDVIVKDLAEESGSGIKSDSQIAKKNQK